MMNTGDKNIWENSSDITNSESRISTLNQSKLNSSAIDIDFRRILSIWPFILLFGLLGYAVGSIYMRYATIIYTVTTSVSLEENQEVTLGQALNGNQRDPLNDKIAYFKSPSLAAQLIDNLQLQYHAEAQGRFRDKDFYSVIKWKIYTLPGEDIPEINFSIFPKDSGFHFVSGKFEGDAQWGFPFLINDKKLIVEKLVNISGNTPIFCYSKNRMASAFELSKSIIINTSKESNIITISYTDISGKRAIDVLNGLITLYNQILEKDKSLGFSQAISFIEQRMSPLRKELDSIESSLASFKSSRAVISGTTGSGLYLQQYQDYDKMLTQINIMESTIKAVEDFIRDPSIKDADLAFVGVDNPTLQSMLMQYQQMRQQRDKIALTAQSTNPTLILMDKNLEDLKGNMEKQLANYKANVKIAKEAYQQKMGAATDILKSAPITEKELMDKTRFQNIKEQLYLTLLQKREEAAIAKASVTVNTKIITPPVNLNATLFPSKSKVLLISILLGMILPIIFAIFKEILNKKIISKKQLQGLTNIPVIAEFQQIENMEKNLFMVGYNDRSMFGEQIRSLRTNLDFFLNTSKAANYILLTSSVSGEGKSFLSMNIAKSYALQGKKVAILEFDLRRPKITKALGFSDVKIGLSTFLLRKNSFKDIIVPIVNTEGETLDLFPSGSIPPNPQEIISSQSMIDLKKELDLNYDIVIIDTPPYGIVADAQILGKWADVTLIVTRFQQTVSDQIFEINEWNQRTVFKSMAIVFNGVKNSGYFGYKYGYYYYKRKYGYNYYSSQPQSEKNNNS